MSRPLLIAVGNPLRGDDGIGPRIAECVRTQAADVDIVVTQQLLPELCEAMARAERVVIVDASGADPPGGIRVCRLTGPPAAVAPALSHQASPLLLLEMAGRLYGRRPPAVLVAVGASRFGLGEDLSAEVAAAVPAVLDELRRLLLAGDSSDDSAASIC
jgi:hydrogenase maturation protease